MFRWIALAGQVATHCPHSEQTPQSRHPPEAKCASSSVSTGSISAKSRGAGEWEASSFTGSRWL